MEEVCQHRPHMNSLIFTMQPGALYTDANDDAKMMTQDNDATAQLHTLSWPLGQISQIGTGCLEAIFMNRRLVDHDWKFHPYTACTLIYCILAVGRYR